MRRTDRVIEIVHYLCRQRLGSTTRTIAEGLCISRCVETSATRNQDERGRRWTGKIRHHADRIADQCERRATTEDQVGAPVLESTSEGLAVRSRGPSLLVCGLMVSGSGADAPLPCMGRSPAGYATQSRRIGRTVAPILAWLCVHSFSPHTRLPP